MSVLAIRGQHARFPDWPTWRAATARPERVRVRVERSMCPHCWGARTIWQPVARRHDDLTRMALPDPRGRRAYLPVVCATCEGRGAIERSVAVIG